MKIALIIDSAAGLTAQKAKELDLYFLPLHIQIDDKDYVDGIDLEPGDVFGLISKNSKTSTSATPIGQAYDLVKELSEKYDKVIVYPISEKLSSQYSNLVTTLKEFEKAYVVKSKKVTLLTIIDILNFRKNIENGMDVNEAISLMEKDFEGKFLLVPKHNDALVRGGRLSPSAAVIAKLLKIVPVIKLENGSLEKEGKGRIFNKTVVNFYKENYEKLPKSFKTVVIHSGNPDIKNIVSELESICNQKIEIFPIPNTIAIHTSNEAIAFGILNIDDDIIKKLKEIFPN